MTRRSLLRAVACGMVAAAAARGAHAQTLCTTTGVTLKSFTPDSLFLNPKGPITVRLLNTTSGCPTDYRVSRYPDFRDAAWTQYGPSLTTTIQLSSFPSSTTGTSQITLYFQLRSKNPKGGIPTYLGGPPAPEYFTSTVIGHSVRIQFTG